MHYIWEERKPDSVQSNPQAIANSAVRADICLDSRKSLRWINIYLTWLAFKLSFHTEGGDSHVGTFAHPRQSLHDQIFSCSQRQHHQAFSQYCSRKKCVLFTKPQEAFVFCKLPPQCLDALNRPPSFQECALKSNIADFIQKLCKLCTVRGGRFKSLIMLS